MGYVPEHLKYNIMHDMGNDNFELWEETTHYIDRLMCNSYSDCNKFSDLVYKLKYPTEEDKINFVNAEPNSETFKPIIVDAIFIDKVGDAIYLIDRSEISNGTDTERLLHIQNCINQYYAIWCQFYSDINYSIDVNSLRPGARVTVALASLCRDEDNEKHILAGLLDIVEYQNDGMELVYLDESYRFHTSVDYLNLYNKLTENKRVKQSNSSSSSSEGCYIASAVYGSYDCPQVWTLRRYRDYKLRQTTLGRLFVKLYYFISPKAVSAFGDNHLFKSFFKRLLDKKVSCLK